MSNYREDIQRITSPDITVTLYNWIILLNFFEVHKDELDINELNDLMIQCENFRNKWNKEHSNNKINKNEVTPNIYEYVNSLNTTLYYKVE